MREEQRLCLGSLSRNHCCKEIDKRRREGEGDKWGREQMGKVNEGERTRERERGGRGSEKGRVERERERKRDGREAVRPFPPSPPSLSFGSLLV